MNKQQAKLSGLHRLFSFQNARFAAVIGPEWVIGGAALRSTVDAAQIESYDGAAAGKVDDLLFFVTVGPHRRPGAGRRMASHGRCRRRQAAGFAEEAEIAGRVRRGAIRTWMTPPRKKVGARRHFRVLAQYFFNIFLTAVNSISI